MSRDRKRKSVRPSAQPPRRQETDESHVELASDSVPDTQTDEAFENISPSTTGASTLSLDLAEAHIIDDPTPEALRYMSVVGAWLAVALFVLYATPPLHRFRPWMPGDPWPVVSRYSDTSGADESIATGGAMQQDAPTDTSQLAAELGSTVAANLGGPGGHAAHVGPLSRIEPTEYEGITQHIVDPTGTGMAPFYEALRATAQETPHAITRVAHYGDSSIATDRITSTVRRNLQTRFGDAGHGFVLVGNGAMAYRHIGLTHLMTDAWRTQEVTRESRSDGRYGFGGIVLRGGGGSRSTLGADPDSPVGRSVSRFEIWYGTAPRLGQIELRIDEGAPRLVQTATETPGDAVEVITLPDGDHRMQVRALGIVEIYGVVLERDVPGVVYDSLGLVGARASRLLNFNPEHIQSQLERRGTNLLVLGFGGNEASDFIDPAVYEASFDRVVQTMRGARTDLGCLIVAPLDQAGREGGAIRTFRGLPILIEAQKRVAARRGCAYFDTFAAMGGAGSMARWYRSNPPLASGDFRHATPEGYEVIGNMIYKAILEGFANYLAQHPAP